MKSTEYIFSTKINDLPKKTMPKECHTNTGQKMALRDGHKVGSKIYFLVFKAEFVAYILTMEVNGPF